MQKMGLEPTRYCYHTDLNRARLPIPPFLRFLFVLGSRFEQNVFYRVSYQMSIVFFIFFKLFIFPFSLIFYHDPELPL